MQKRHRRERFGSPKFQLGEKKIPLSNECRRHGALNDVTCLKHSNCGGKSFPQVETWGYQMFRV